MDVWSVVTRALLTHLQSTAFRSLRSHFEWSHVWFQHIVLLRVLQRAGLHLHHGRRLRDALVLQLSPLPVRFFSVQRLSSAFLQQRSHQRFLRQLEPVLHQLHAERLQPLSGHHLVRQHWPGLGCHLPGECRILRTKRHKWPLTDVSFSGYISRGLDGHHVLRSRRSQLLGLDLFCSFDRCECNVFNYI